MMFNPTILNHVMASIFLILSTTYSIYEMNKRIDLKNLFETFKIRFKSQAKFI